MAAQPTPTWRIAQLSIGRTVAPVDDTRLADFTGRLDEINALAERCPTPDAFTFKERFAPPADSPR